MEPYLLNKHNKHFMELEEYKIQNMQHFKNKML